MCGHPFKNGLLLTNPKRSHVNLLYLPCAAPRGDCTQTAPLHCVPYHASSTRPPETRHKPPRPSLLSRVTSDKKLNNLITSHSQVLAMGVLVGPVSAMWPWAPFPPECGGMCRDAVGPRNCSPRRPSCRTRPCRTARLRPRRDRGLADIARRVIQRFLNPRFLS